MSGDIRPSGLHLLNGLYDEDDGQPVLEITSHTFQDLIGTRFQAATSIYTLI